jgi:hypothetical protein
LTWQPDPITSSPGDVAEPHFHIIRDSTAGEIAVKKYVVKLTEEERERLD